MLVAREMIEDLQECIVCNTDASKTTDNKAGIGIYIPKKNVNISLRTSSHSCISSIELAAIEDCLIHVKDSYQGETFDIVILSDSLSALEALKDCNHIDRDINKTLNIISEIQESGRKVTLVWVPVHTGIPGNEKAAALANAATTSEQINRWIPASIKDVKRSVARNIIQQWRTRWVADPRGQHYKTTEKLVSTKSKFQCASRRKEILTSKLRIVKCALNLNTLNTCFSWSIIQTENARYALRRMKMSGISSCNSPVSPEGRNKTPNKSIWDEFHAQQSIKYGPHFQMDLQKSE